MYIEFSCVIIKLLKLFSLFLLLFTVHWIFCASNMLLVWKFHHLRTFCCINIRKTKWAVEILKTSSFIITKSIHIVIMASHRIIVVTLVVDILLWLCVCKRACVSACVCVHVAANKAWKKYNDVQIYTQKAREKIQWNGSKRGKNNNNQVNFLFFLLS